MFELLEPVNAVHNASKCSKIWTEILNLDLCPDFIPPAPGMKKSPQTRGVGAEKPPCLNLNASCPWESLHFGGGGGGQTAQVKECCNQSISCRLRSASELLIITCSWRCGVYSCVTEGYRLVQHFDYEHTYTLQNMNWPQYSACINCVG